MLHYTYYTPIPLNMTAESTITASRPYTQPDIVRRSVFDTKDHDLTAEIEKLLMVLDQAVTDRFKKGNGIVDIAAGQSLPDAYNIVASFYYIDGG